MRPDVFHFSGGGSTAPFLHGGAVVRLGQLLLKLLAGVSVKSAVESLRLPFGAGVSLSPFDTAAATVGCLALLLVPEPGSPGQFPKRSAVANGRASANGFCPSARSGESISSGFPAALPGVRRSSRPICRAHSRAVRAFL